MFNKWRTWSPFTLFSIYFLALVHCDPISTSASHPSASLSLALSNTAATVQAAEASQTQQPPDPDANKYFHEPGGDDLLHHYDIRYFQKIVTDEERQDTLKHLIRAYLLTFEYLGLETWIAHGTLLAWYWNGQILPWDWDLDTQACRFLPSPLLVTDEGLKALGKHYNQTFYDYDQGNGTPTRRYFLDVNSWAWQRDRGDGANIIDARFISVDNGLFIDITGLSEVYPDTQPGIIMCKNDHKYRLRDMFPLRETHFEGVKAKVPYSYVPILIEEYSDQALVRTEFHE
ncbi:uncharacterized protein A1O9_12626 [Exophiala aquamarina CBS 119918]|uniref:LicD/FKTN/FKRP nucleotidyltransferase domain-containing protein n=1 Tax=Exophiala aquamarina CBS 119918 TaxID=1182545 RepID=A0A072NUL5_9EURO|nr:uncharacterized protein A1O9_12626 [Exophiala aquamarina CBS 119918]KEF51276.1 hypothetical protein A1O9_12626 [Exophiala aquamarina CBS 119918]